MFGLRLAGKKSVVIFLTVLSSVLLLVYVNLTPSLPPPILPITLPPNFTTIKKLPSSPASKAPPPTTSAPLKPIQPAVPSVIYTKDIYRSGHQSPHAEICPSLGVHLKVLILITSAPDHESARNAVRFTWGNFAKRSDLAIAFFLGLPPEHLKESLNKEDSFYRDLIIGNNIDSYKNLTLKTISMLEWTSIYCPRVPYMLKTDDDVFINIPRFLKFLKQPSVVSARKVIWGRIVWRLLNINREQWHKHYVPPAQFPGRRLPDFCAGPAYLMTGDCILPLLKAAPKERYFGVEDMFITGVLAQIVRIKRWNEYMFSTFRVNETCFVRQLISIHEVRPYEQFELWRTLLDNRLTCRTPARKRFLAIPIHAHIGKNR